MKEENLVCPYCHAKLRFYKHDNNDDTYFCDCLLDSETFKKCYAWRKSGGKWEHWVINEKRKIYGNWFPDTLTKGFVFR
jgi:predicted amidophosphoribosyltransferase